MDCTLSIIACRKIINNIILSVGKMKKKNVNYMKKNHLWLNLCYLLHCWRKHVDFKLPIYLFNTFYHLLWNSYTTFKTVICSLCKLTLTFINMNQDHISSINYDHTIQISGWFTWNMGGICALKKCLFRAPSQFLFRKYMWWRLLMTGKLQCSPTV